ncbi:hypothetical protein ACFFQF_32155 [Haladaptatus pallidirubidus]|uniref:hypothetical protein n=1 Tax=Haladaptatus pallidirubidus TaxID=1008152 RepID=UPI0035E9B633
MHANTRRVLVVSLAIILLIPMLITSATAATPTRRTRCFKLLRPTDLQPIIRQQRRCQRLACAGQWLVREWWLRWVHA